MLNHRTLKDIALGGGLVLALLVVFIVDRLVSAPAPRDAADESVAVRKGGTLLGDDQISVRIKALGSQERLEKLRVVRLTAKSSFADATNVNDITMMWCWEPNITMRFQEVRPEHSVRAVTEIIDRQGRPAQDKLLHAMKAEFDLEGKFAAQFEEEARALFAARNYKPFFDSVLILEGKNVFRVFNDRLSMPLKQMRAMQMRNLCFALSVSNLIPIRRHKFHVETGVPEIVKGRICDQFNVRDPDGLQLQFYFDEETNLLAKIGHMGHDPRARGVADKQVYWEHYFSDYREAEGIKQWRRSEAHTDGRPFATLDVTGVEFFDDMRSDLLRPELRGASGRGPVFWITIVVGVVALLIVLSTAALLLRRRPRRRRKARDDFV